MTTVHLRLKSGTDYTQNRQLSKLLRDTLRSVTPVRTGKLRRGWRVINYNSRSITVQNDVEYGIWVDLGTATITPRRFTERGVDRFIDRAGGLGISIDTLYKLDINYA